MENEKVILEGDALEAVRNTLKRMADLPLPPGAGQEAVDQFRFAAKAVGLTDEDI